ncbi:MAG: transcriptional regulator, partial [Desulfobacteraceae bacterium]|nr:transcriptional regulator [Desulfobacteraceae bacterium]
PLSARKEDIQILAQAFLKDSNQNAGKNICRFSTSVMEAFHAHDWPGNIRELQNIIEYSVNMEDSDTITLESLPQRFLDKNTPLGIKPSLTTPLPRDIRSAAMTAQMEAIISCLDRHGHDVRGKTLTAKELGISLRTLYRKLKPREKDN